MANPNIVSVTSIYGESLGEALTTTVTTVIMTVSTSALVKINYISVTNTHATNAIDVSVAITKAGFTSAGVGSSDDNADIFFLCKIQGLEANEVLIVLDKPIYLMEADVLKGGANYASTLALYISYEIINDA